MRKEYGSLILLALIIESMLPCLAQNAPMHFQQLQAEGIQFLKARDYVKANERFEAALKLHSSWQTLQNIATCQSKLGNFQPAVSALEKSIEIGGLHSSQCTIMAGALEGLGEPKKALAWLELACKIEPAQVANPGMQAAIRMLKDPMQNPPGSPTAPEYLASLVAIQKWHLTDFPIKVFVRKNIQLPEFHNEFVPLVQDALTQWCQATGNVVSYKFVNDKESANIVFDYTDRRELVSPEHDPGLDGNANNRVRFDDHSIDWSNITVLVKDSPSSPFRPSPKIKKCLLHEIGHALGMHGHSSNRHDIMFSASTPEPISKLSQRDINTIQKIYPKK